MHPSASAWLPRALVALALLVTAFLLVHDIGRSPRIWYDEGAHLHVAENLAVNGVYADFSSEGDRYTGPVLGVGPTVILPIAGLFKLLGVELAPARLVIVLYCIGTLGVLFAMCRTLGDWKLAAIAAAVMFSLPDFTFFGRSVLGEMPGLFFLLAGLWLWFSPGHKGAARLIGAGVLFGLASITKNQYAFIIIPSLLIAWALQSLRPGGPRRVHFVLPFLIAGAAYAAWTLFVLFLLGNEKRDVWSDFEVLRSTSQYALFQWRWENLRTLWWSFPVYGVLCAIAFPFWLLFARKRSQRVEQWDTLIVFVLVAALLYVTSLGWTRYAFPVLMLSVPVTAALLRQVAALDAPWPLLPRTSDVAKKRLRGAGTVLVVLSLSAAAGQQILATLNQGNHDDALEMASYLETNLPAGTVIETLEQEFAIFTDLSFHYPPQSVVVAVTDEWIRRGLTHSESYDQIHYASHAEYVLVGTCLSRAFYSPRRLAGYRPLWSFGKYTLFCRTPCTRFR